MHLISIVCLTLKSPKDFAEYSDNGLRKEWTLFLIYFHIENVEHLCICRKACEILNISK